MRKMIFWIAGCMILNACQNNEAGKASAASNVDSTQTTTTAPVEFLDSSFNAIGDKALSDFAKGDFDAFISGYTDDTHLVLASGDSVSGKPNILKYWKTTMTGVDSIRFNKPIYLAVKVNESKQIQTGNWLLMWYDFTLYLKNGKKLTGHTHDVVHLTINKKADYQLHYADNAPVMAAMKMK